MTDLSAPRVPLSGGTSLPQVALGTWPMNDEEVKETALLAFDIGYRHVDTAENYENERGVGAAVRECGLPRDEVFVTTKFNRKWHADPAAGLAQSLERLGLDYADLVLIHWPNPDQDRYLQAWEGLIALREQGLARAIGTSNFTPEHLRRIIDATGVVPEVNQVEMHPYVARERERAFHAEHGILTEAWSPLGRDNGLRDEPLVKEIAQAHGRTPAQVLLRWDIELGAATAPKSANRQRLTDNLDIFGFQLSPEEVASLTALTAPPGLEVMDPDTFGH